MDYVDAAHWSAQQNMHELHWEGMERWKHWTTELPQTAIICLVQCSMQDRMLNVLIHSVTSLKLLPSLFHCLSWGQSSCAYLMSFMQAWLCETTRWAKTNFEHIHELYPLFPMKATCACFNWEYFDWFSFRKDWKSILFLQMTSSSPCCSIASRRNIPSVMYDYDVGAY